MRHKTLTDNKNKKEQNYFDKTVLSFTLNEVAPIFT